MNSNLSRRQMIQAVTAAALSPAVMTGAVQRPHVEGPKTPKVCLGISPDTDQAGMRRVKQIGVDYVLMGGPPIPWLEADIRARMERFKSGGLTVCNMMISGFPNTLYGRPGRDEE